MAIHDFRKLCWNFSVMKRISEFLFFKHPRKLLFINIFFILIQLGPEPTFSTTNRKLNRNLIFHRIFLGAVLIPENIELGSLSF